MKLSISKYTHTYICLYRGFVLVRGGFCSGSFVRGFCLEGFARGRFCPSPCCHNTSVITEN